MATWVRGVAVVVMGTVCAGAVVFAGSGSWRSQGYVRAQLNPPMTPALGEYQSRDPKVVDQHVRWCAEYGIDVLACSWWGPQSGSHTTMAGVLAPAMERAGKTQFFAFYETRGRLVDGPSSIVLNAKAEQTLKTDLVAIVRTLATSPKYWRVDNKPVIGFYLTRILQGDLGVLDRVRSYVKTETGEEVFLLGDEVYWNVANTKRMAAFDAVTSYNMHAGKSTGGFDDDSGFTNNTAAVYERYRAVCAKLDVRFVPGVVPGFNDLGVRPQARHVVIPRRVNAGAANTSLLDRQLAMAAGHLDAKLPLVLITSFNEWYEDSQLEPDVGAGATTEPVQLTGGFPYEPYELRALERVRAFKRNHPDTLVGAYYYLWY